MLALSQLTGAVNGTIATAEQIKSAMESAGKTLENRPTASKELGDEARRIGREADAILKEVRGE